MAKPPVPPPEVPTPIVVNPNPVGENVASAGRVVIILIGGVAAILGFLRTHDIAGLVVFLQSAAFVPILGAASALAAFLYGQWKIIFHKRQLVTAARSADDDVAVVQSPPASKG